MVGKDKNGLEWNSAKFSVKAEEYSEHLTHSTSHKVGNKYVDDDVKSSMNGYMIGEELYDTTLISKDKDAKNKDTHIRLSYLLNPNAKEEKKEKRKKVSLNIKTKV